MLRYCLLPLFLGLFFLVACSSDQAPSVTQEILSVDTTYESRGVMVPATIVTPADSGGRPMPLVVMAHGHGGSRQEGGGFQMVAEAMAKRGIASIRMDFPAPVSPVITFRDETNSKETASISAKFRTLIC